ncbi:nitrite reductase small subunit NirD [Gordonia sp. CPCC 205515]|uniref:nitrite reductase small subunit NirD n=1 Tax=Gordonia sp. CPCC 205515 TaxID=3140791 RepID=UPI003AF3A48C
MTIAPTRTWVPVCTLTDLVPGRGVAALIDDTQVAIFRLPSDGEDPAGAQRALRAVGNIDPFGRAAVMSRGLVGDRGGEPTVASPLLKQVFSLNTGRCLDDEGVRLPVYGIRVDGDVVQVSLT